MSRNLVARRAGVLAVAVVAGIAGTASPVLADVTVSPPSAPQGSGANVHLDVENTGQRAITRVKVVMPADTPVAEVFPLSVDDWAPQIETMTLATPLTSIHGGTPVHETAASITWIAVNGPLRPGRSADLAVALGPLPTASRMTFTVIPTYDDGTVGPAMSGATLMLTPPQPGHSGHGDGSGPASPGDAPVAAQANEGPGLWSVAGWVIAALAVAGALVAMLRGRRRARPGGGTDETGRATEPVAAGAKITAWSYRDGPD